MLKPAVPDSSSKFYSLNKKFRIAMYQFPKNNLNRLIQEQPKNSELKRFD